MAHVISELFKVLTTVSMSLGLILGILLYLLLPYMAWSVTRNIKGIREQLEALNDTLGSKMTITKSGPLGL
jgi:uncharacterized membrane protein YciS (DUF1049 family)